jgi:hypothetical protein
VALIGVAVSIMNSSTRYSAKALSSDELVEGKERFFELTSRVSAIVRNGRNTYEVLYSHTP